MAGNRKILLLGMTIVASYFNIFAQHLTSDEVGVLIERTREKFDIPAVAVSVINSRSVFINELQGTRVSGTENYATKDDYFHIGSCSKSVLGLLAGKFVELGKINWTTKFFTIFPELKKVTKSDYADITLEDLFLCEAGIAAYTSGEEKFPEINSSVQKKRCEFAKYLLQQPPASELKSDGRFKHLYSNASYTLAALMLERTSGKTYEELVTQTLFESLAIKIHIGWPNSSDNDQPWGHLINKEGVKPFAPDHEYKFPYLLTPAGDLSMIPLDYARYVQLHLQGLRGDDNYLTNSTFKHLHYAHKGFSIGIANGKLMGRTFSGMDGSAGTFFCRSIIIPDSDFAFAIMMNAGSGTAEMKAIDWLTMKILKKYYNQWWKFWM